MKDSISGSIYNLQIILFLGSNSQFRKSFKTI